MTLGIYSIRDQRVGWLTPTVDRNDQSAIRNFQFAVMNEQSIFHTHCQDFSLYRIAYFDDQTAELTTFEPELLFDGKSFK